MKKLIREALHQEILNQIFVTNIEGDDLNAIFSMIKREFGGSEVPDEYITNEIISDVDTRISYKAVVNDKIVAYILVRPVRINTLIKGKDVHIINKEIKANNGQGGFEGLAFYIEPQYRGIGLDRKLIGEVSKAIGCSTYVVAEVMKSLHTHNYWKKFGFVPYLEYDDLILYIKLC